MTVFALGAVAGAGVTLTILTAGLLIAEARGTARREHLHAQRARGRSWT